MHGRESYRRNSFATLYIFYKNILYTSPIFYFGIWSLFSGTMCYHLLLYNMFNPAFTSIPIVWYATMDFEHPKEKLLNTPSLYKYGIRNLHFNNKIFLREILHAFLQSLFITWFSLHTLTNDVNSEGKSGSYADTGAFIFCCMVVVANFKVLVSVYTLSIFIFLTVILSITAYTILQLLVGSDKNLDFYGTGEVVGSFP